LRRKCGDGMLVELNLARLTDKEEAQKYLKEAFGFPDYYGMNLDALHDCLTQLGPTQVRLTGDEDAPDSEYRVRIMRVFADAAEENPDLELITGKKKIVQTAGRDALGEFAPDFAHFNDDILFGENWNNEDIDLKTRSIITVVALMAQGITDSSLKYHILNAKNHGVSQKEMAAVITHVAFYAGWPKAWAVFNLAKEVYKE